ncbi:MULTISPECIES: hypothetical protein [unclassified Acinetobacter]|uniref:hypothetical protein n=1 Tax=unclassified Acinetobacter TaxID=196816 RepID=UPI002934DE3A|nr:MULTISPECIES: hypothetical protein [unclassified Acinetobacter]WOE32969.1 hypothetical protein QSG84_07425 [Acinetobacter sp. SAAs470]WOE38446.1 hypothetical protein QSG86_16480 [Acinetobacter sp. SAAs474]
MKQNPIPYYTLKQASKILNEKFKTTVYNSKTILSMSLYYQIRLHVLFFGNWSVSCDCHVPIELITEENKLIYKKIVLEIENTIEHSMRDSVLLKLNEEALNSLASLGKFDTRKDAFFGGFDGVLRVGYIFESENFDSILDAFLKRSSAASILSEEQINNIEILAIYPTKTDESNCKPRAKPYIDDEEELVDYYPYIKLEDVLITHLQLEKILNGELESQYFSNKKINNEEIGTYLPSSERRGISLAKRNAKLAASTLAQYLWNKDTDKNIKLIEMARIVHSELQKTEHHTQLPSIEAVKEWLRLIAPSYARLAGRPQQTND